MRLLVGVYVMVACLLAAASCETLVFNDRHFLSHKLPETVKPTKYDVDLSFDSLDSEVYKGQVNISLDVDGPSPCAQAKLREISENGSTVGRRLSDCIPSRGYVAEIILHADPTLDIEHIQVTSSIFLGHLLVKNHKIMGLFRDREKQMILIELENELRSYSKAKISFTFSGRMNKDKRGVYVSQYNDGSQVHKQIVSQFQPTFARTVFPCFDEPRFRVPVKLTLHHPNGLTAYGNTQGSYKKGTSMKLATTKFKKTPATPLHMFAFTVGKFDRPLEITLAPLKGSKVRTKPVKVRVITAPGKHDSGYFALQVAENATKWFEEYIDYPLPTDKLDIITVADLDKDNAESWGLAFIRDTNLWIDDETKEETCITTAVNVAHVVVHQWFGNLISVNKWQDIWITEGVAAQMAFKFVEELYPSQSEFLIRLGILSSVMQADQTGKLHKLSPPDHKTHLSDDIYMIFDQLEFMKSASLAQMLSEQLGAPKYNQLLQQLVAKHAHRTIPYEDYIDMLLDQSQFVETLESFIRHSGVPLVIVEVHDVKTGTLSVEPKKKLVLTLGEERSGQRFYTKAGFVKVDGNIRQEDIYYNESLISTPYWFDDSLSKDRVFFKLSLEPTISAYFRTSYSDDLFEMLVNAVRQKWLGPMDRIQLLNDANNLVQAKLMKNESFVNLVAAYEDEEDNAVLIELLAAHKTLERLGLESPLMQTFLEKFYAEGFALVDDESLLNQRARQDILKALVAQQEKTVVESALEAFKDPDEKDVALFLREPVYAAVVQAGKKEQVESLLDRLRRTRSYQEKIRLVTALSGSKDNEVLDKVRNWLESSGLKAETIKPFQDSIDATLASLKLKE